MDLLNTPALETAGAALIDRAQKATDEVVDRAATALDLRVGPLETALCSILKGALQGLQDVEGKAVMDLHGVLDRLNGAELKFIDGGFKLYVPPRT